VLQRRTELLLGDGVVVGSLVAKKVVVGMVVLFSTISYLQYHRRRDSTYPAGGLEYSISEGLVAVEQLVGDNHLHTLDCGAHIGMQVESGSLMHLKDFHNHDMI
jgi:hypothetical protein